MAWGSIGGATEGVTLGASLSPRRRPDTALVLCSIFKGYWKENNMHGCGKKWYPGGALEEVRALSHAW